MSEQDQERLIDSIYAAAGDKRLWSEALQELRRRLDASMIALLQSDRGSPRYDIQETAEVPQEAIRLYAEHYAVLDSWGIAGKSRFVEGWVGRGEELVCSDDLRKTEFYSDFLRQFSMFHQAGIVLRKSESSLTFLTMHRSESQPDFGEDTLRFLHGIYPHLYRALQIHRKMVELKHESENYSAAFDRVPFGVVLLDSNAKIIVANRAASEICVRVENGLQLVAASVHARSSKDDRDLKALIASATHPKLGNSGGGALQISRENHPPLVVVVTPISKGEWPSGSSVAVFITAPEHQALTSIQTLKSVFNLTGAEANVAALLARGITVTEASEQLDVSVNTIKTQLMSIFAKTNTSRQSQLIAIVSKLPR